MMNFSHLHFAEPAWLWLSVAAPCLLVWLHGYAARARRAQLAQMASPHFVGELTKSHSSARRHGKNILLLVVWVLAGLALARPQWGALETGQTWIGEDVVFALDCSASMTASDVLPSRLQRAKFAILDFVQRRNHGRVGLVGFAGSAFIQCPLTFDTGAFEETLLAMDEKTLPIPGTDIGRALGEANQAMDKTSHHKLVILVTDGEDLEKSGIAEAKMLATNGVVVFTIGVGTTEGKEIQVLNAAGQTEWLRDDKGQVVRSHLDEATLREIAQVTGGSYYPLGTLGEGMARIHPAAAGPGDKQAGREAGVERFHPFIAVLLILLVAESLISTRRKELPEPA